MAKRPAKSQSPKAPQWTQTELRAKCLELAISPTVTSTGITADQVVATAQAFLNFLTPVPVSKGNAND